jgi:hypothetical protein
VDRNASSTCAACGAELPAEVVTWCPQCGAPLSTDREAWEISTAVPPEEVPVATDAETPARGWRSLPAACGTYLKGLAARPRALAAVAAVCVAVLAGIGTGAYFLATRADADDLYPVLVDGKTGFIDRFGKMVIEPQKQDDRMFSSGFSEGRALMVVDGKAGFIDTEGDYVIPLQYDGADDFSEGLAAVWRGTQLLYVDTAGNVAIEAPGMTEGGRFSEGLAAFGSPLDVGSKYGYMDKRGNVVISPRFAAVGEFSEGLAAVEVEVGGGGGLVWGYVDKTGVWVIQPEFTSAGPFSDGLAAVRKSNQDFGFIDKTGAWAIHPEPAGFLYAESFSEGLACVEVMAGEYHDTPKFGFIDKSGDMVIEATFDTPGYFSQGRAAMGMFGQEQGVAYWGYIDKSGEWVVEPTYLKSGPFQPGGLAAVVRSGSAWMVPDPPRGYLGVVNYGPKMIDSGPPDVVYIDKSGKIVWETYQQAATTTLGGGAADYTIAGTDLYPVPVGGKVGFIDGSGTMVIEPRQMDNLPTFSEGIATVFVDGKAGFIDAMGEYLVEPSYEGASHFSEGLAVAYQATDHIIYIDKTGQTAIDVPGMVEGRDFSEGLTVFGATIDFGTKYGYMDKKGSVVIAPQFVYADDFSDGLAAVATGNDGWGYIDMTGAWVVEPAFTGAKPFSEGLAAVSLGDRNGWGYIDRTGAWVVEPRFAQAQPFSEGLASVELPPDSTAGSADSGGFAFIDYTGKLAIDSTFAGAWSFSEGLAPAARLGEDGALSWGYIDPHGDWVVEPQYWQVGPFRPGGLAAVLRSPSPFFSELDMHPRSGGWQGSLDGYFTESVLQVDLAYIDRSGRVVWETPQATPLVADTGWLYPVFMGDGQVGYLDANGVALPSMPSDGLPFFSEGLAPISVDGKAGYIDETGAFVIQPVLGGAGDFHEGLAAVSRDGTLEYIDPTGATAIQVPGMVDAREFSEGLAAFAVGKGETAKYGYLDKTGTVVIEPQFVWATPFSEGYAAVAVGEPGKEDEYRWGYIDTSGAWVVQPTYAYASAVELGKGAVRRAGSDSSQWDYIDMTGARAIEPPLLGFAEARGFSEGFAAVGVASTVGGPIKWGFIDGTGAMVIAPQFEAVADFSQGMAAFALKDDWGQAKWGYIDMAGTVVVQPQYQFAGPFLPGGVALVVGSGREPVVEYGSPDRYLGFWRIIPGGSVYGDDQPSSLAYIDKKGTVVWETPALPSIRD